MPSFSYVAREAASGREVRNVLEANTEQEAIAQLLGRNMLVVSIQEASGKKGRAASGSVPMQDLVMFTRQLATMIDAGLAIVQSLQALAEQTNNKIMRDVIRDICARVESGDNFSAALMKHPKTFDRLFYCMVDAGEKGGLLSEILSRLATYLENTVRLRKKVKSAMMYPTVVTLVAITITSFLLVKVVPTFGEIFSGFGAKLPTPTQYLIDFSEWMKKWWWVMLLVAGAGVYSWLAFIKTKVGEEFWDRNRIRLPVFGHIAHKICLARFARTLASLIRSGVPILEVLNITANVVGNVVMEKAIRSASADIEKGDGIAAALGRHPVFPVMIIRMLTAGEQTGKIDAMLERVADFLDDEIETILGGLTSLIEPLLIVFLGVVVGGIVICMFLPIFKMSEIINPPGR
ncbi:MAG: type II secretion system F family protein [Verrucomicrobia bacterium]|nr:type II secretion system F family protein [Verrucomicrobiota bacterium]NBU09167.1 type II secretion system F family protein [Pseudomonadota bacterium]NDA65316.1 type II secretion system F family protein [Verrucomicrobiota bacterium]NDB74972.1 type II secretion system F family protein [Verrucomicrobiota bacterium]NDE97021.1 type II secretion system F family protein [Verrucomicrobiota bacterium]